MIIKMELVIIMLFTEKNGPTFIYILFIYLNVTKINWLQPLTLKKLVN